MSIRRDFGDVVQLDEDEGGTFHGRILSPSRGAGFDPCLKHVLGTCSDSDCREWWTLEVLEDQRNATGEYAYHIPECAMRDPGETLEQAPLDETDGH
jgi:hypothetical protein